MRKILHEGRQWRGSGADADSYFQLLQEHESAVPRHAFGRRKSSEAWAAYGGIPGVAYRLTLTTLAMGGTNAPSFAQSALLGVLRRAGYPDDKCLVYDKPFVDRDLLVGVVLDVVLVLADVATADVDKPNLADQNLAIFFVRSIWSSQPCIFGEEMFRMVPAWGDQRRFLILSYGELGFTVGLEELVPR